MKNKYEIIVLKKHNIHNQIINNKMNNNNSKLSYSLSSTNISNIKDYIMKQDNKKN